MTRRTKVISHCEKILDASFKLWLNLTTTEIFALYQNRALSIFKVNTLYNRKHQGQPVMLYAIISQDVADSLQRLKALRDAGHWATSRH